MAHVAVTTTLPVLDCLWLQEVKHTLKKMGKHSFQHGNSLIERRSSLPSPSNYLHTNVVNTMRERPSFQTATMFSCNKIGRLKQTGSAYRGLSLIRQARSETKPTTSPFDFMQFLAQHVQGYVAAQCHLCHLPILQEEGDFVAGPMQPDDVQRIITHTVFTRFI